jgi:hypothetical protein
MFRRVFGQPSINGRRQAYMTHRERFIFVVTRPEPSYRIVDVLNHYTLMDALKAQVSGVIAWLIVVDTAAKKYREMRFQAETFFPDSTEEDLRAVMALSEPLAPAEVRFHAWVELVDDTTNRPITMLPREHALIVLDTVKRTGLVFPLS